MKRNFLLMFIFFLLSPQMFAIDKESLKKYPNILLTNDYGILNEANLKRDADGMVTERFNWDPGKGFDYWQCFPTKDVEVWYKKWNYDPEEKVIMGDPRITVKISPDVVYNYEPRRAFSLDYAKNKVRKWNRLIKNQQYVCIGGSFAGTHKKIENGKEITEHGWIFENLKTKKGCDSYFSGWCD